MARPPAPQRWTVAGCNQAGGFLRCLARRSRYCRAALRRRATRSRRSDEGMAGDVRIGLDAMGGDHGPTIVLAAAAIALERRPDIKFLLYGDKSVIAPIVERHPKLAAGSRVFHTD